MEVVSKLPCRLTEDGIVRLFSQRVNGVLAAWQKRMCAEPGSFEAIEAEALALVRPFAGFLTLAVMEHKPVRKAVCEAAERLRVDAPGRPRQVYRRPRVLRLLCGLVVTVLVGYCAPRRRSERGFQRGVGRRGAEGVGLYPEWAALGIREGVSPGLQSEAARSVVLLHSMSASREELARQGVALDVKTLRRIALEISGAALRARREDVERFRRGAMPAGHTLAGLRVAVAIDGGRARVRVNKKGKHTRKGRQRFATPWREPKLARIYVLDERGRIDRARPAWVDGTFQGPDALMEWVAMHLHRLGAAQATRVVFLGDGADWIWDRVGAVVTRAGLDPRRVFQAVDLCHVLAQLATALEAKGALSPKDRKRELTKLRKKLKAGSLDEVMAYLQARAKGRGARAVQGVLAYLRKRERLLRYDLLQSKRLPIGSGAVESAIRRVVNLRLKAPGTFWKEEHVEGLLLLRAAALTGRWEELMERVRLLAHSTRLRDWKWEPTPYSVKATPHNEVSTPPKDKRRAA